MDYIGSKEKLNPWIFEQIERANIKGDVFLDACSGSCSTSRFSAKQGYKVISCDVLAFSKSIANGSIGLSSEEKGVIKKEIEKINSLSGIKGFFYNNYSESAGKTFFVDENAKKIDHCRRYIEQVPYGKIRDNLIYAALEGISRVLNTTGVQAAFLKSFKERARKPFELRNEYTVDGLVIPFTNDIASLLKDAKYRQQIKEDILYIDPPYNQRQYGPNYHLYETFVRNDNPTIRGLTGLRDWKLESKSKFCSKQSFFDILSEIILLTTAKGIFLSYSSDGLFDCAKIASFLKKYGDVKIFSKEQKRYKADSSNSRIYKKSDLYEFLFQLKTRDK